MKLVSPWRAVPESTRTKQVQHSWAVLMIHRKLASIISWTLSCFRYLNRCVNTACNQRSSWDGLFKQLIWMARDHQWRGTWYWWSWLAMKIVLDKIDLIRRTFAGQKCSTSKTWVNHQLDLAPVDLMFTDLNDDILFLNQETKQDQEMHSGRMLMEIHSL